MLKTMRLYKSRWRVTCRSHHEFLGSAIAPSFTEGAWARSRLTAAAAARYPPRGEAQRFATAHCGTPRTVARRVFAHTHCAMDTTHPGAASPRGAHGRNSGAG
jgi:hypothetical protein